MKDNKDYEQAVLQAKENFADLQERGNDAVGGDALALLDNLLTSEEIMESNLRVSLIGEIIKARQERGISQKSKCITTNSVISTFLQIIKIFFCL